MKRSTILHNILNFLIAMVWLLNGLFCKLLDLVPRHRLIVARILGDEYALTLTRAIGLSEVLMAAWVISGLKPRLCALAQIVVVALMNAIEFFKAPDLLLFGRYNAVWALLFILVVFSNEFLLNKKPGHSR